MQPADVAAKKDSIVDVLCTDQHGAQYIIEMQVAKTTGFEKWAQYYASKAYVSQMNAGDRYQDLKEVIFLAIADYVIFPKKEAYKSSHYTLDHKTGENDLDKLFFTFVELPKFQTLYEKGGMSLVYLTLEERWYYFLIHAAQTTDEELEILSSSPEIEEAYQVLSYFSLNAEELRTYELAEKHRLDELAIYDKIREDAEERGRKQGREEGREEEKLDIARQMLKEGESIEKIVRWTGLSQVQIDELQQG